jgi:hypothetical protein
MKESKYDVTSTKFNYKKLLFKLFLVKKSLYQQLFIDSEQKKIIFINGCQRSGSTLLGRIFNRDYRTSVFEEKSSITSDDKIELRLNEYSKVLNEFNLKKGSIIVAKPLVESQNLLELLTYFPNSYSVWIYRDYKDVALSNEVKFGTHNGFDDLNFILKQHNNNWRYEKTSKETFNLIKKYSQSSITNLDACCLFWYSRNIHFIEKEYNLNKRILLLNYNNLIQHPEQSLKRIYDLIEAQPPKNNLIKDVKSGSIGKAKDIIIHQEINTICNNLYTKLSAMENERSG